MAAKLASPLDNMQHRKLLALALVLWAAGAEAGAGAAPASHPGDRGNHLVASVNARNIVDSDKGAQYSVFFIPAYRLTPNKTSSGTYNAHPGPVLGPVSGAQQRLPLDPRLLTARLVGAALEAVVRNATAAHLPSPAHAKAAGAPRDPERSALLVRRNPEGEQTLPAQHHDAHILVTVQRPPGAGATSTSTSGHHLPLLPVGLGTAHIYNNYPALQGHVPAHYGATHLPHYYFGHLPAPAQVPAPAGLLAQQSGIVSVSPGTLLGTTGPVYASPGHPAGTLQLSSTTPLPPVALSTATSTSSRPSHAERTTDSSKEDMSSKSEQTESFEIIRTTSVKQQNHSEEVKDGGSSPSPTAEETTPRPPSTQETSPTTASETTDLNKPATPDQPPPSSSGQPQPQPTLPGQVPQPLPSLLPYPNPTGYQNPGFVFGGYSPVDYNPRYNFPLPLSTTSVPPPNVNYRGTSNLQPYGPHPSQQTPVGGNRQYGNNFTPFYDPGYIPGFAPGYPFGVPSRNAEDPNNYRRPTGPPVGIYERFPPAGGSSQENTRQENRPTPAKFQSGGTSAEDVSGSGPPRQQQYTGFGNIPYVSAPFPQNQHQQLLQQRQPQQYHQPQRPLLQPQLQQQLAQQLPQQQLQPTQASGSGGFTTPNPYFRPFNQPTQPFGLNPQYNQFADEFLSPGRGQRLPTFYTGPLPNQQTQQLPRPTPSPTDPGDLVPLFNPQQYQPPFGFTGNPFYPDGERVDPEARQSQIEPRTSLAERRVSTKLHVKRDLGPRRRRASPR